MNPVVDILFSISWFILLIITIRQVSKAWSNEPVRQYNDGDWHPMRDSGIHPEMVGVEPGEELMGVTFRQRTSCDLEEYKDLQARIDKLREELEDEDDDGGSLVPTVR